MGTDGELEVGTQYAERLVYDVALASLHYHLAHLLRLLPEPDALLEGWAVLATHIVWNLAQERNIHVLQVLPATHGGIHALTHEDDDYRNEESQHEGYEHDVAAHRCHRLVVARRRGDDAGIVGGECLGKLVLLALLEEEEIERLLDLLLATHGLQVLSLVRIAGNLGGSGSLVCLQGAQLGLEGYHEVVETGSDALAHGAKALVVVSHQWVLLARVSHQVVTLQLTLVVFSNLLLYARALDACIGRQELVLAHLAGEIVSDILGNGEARVEIHDLLVHLGALLHILLCGSLYIR